MSDEMHARLSDPVTSEHRLNTLDRDQRFKDIVLDCALELGTFSDTALTYAVERRLGTRQQRNVVARTRLNWEREGRIERLPYTDGQGELVFVVLL